MPGAGHVLSKKAEKALEKEYAEKYGG